MRRLEKEIPKWYGNGDNDKEFLEIGSARDQYG